MPRQPSGSIDVVVLADGTRAFRLRFRAHGKRQREVVHERPGCACGCGGGWDERRARVELDNILARVRAGIWKPRAAAPVRPAPAVVPTFHEYASAWLAAKVQGVLGDKPIDRNPARGKRMRVRVPKPSRWQPRRATGRGIVSLGYRPRAGVRPRSPQNSDSRNRR